MFGDGIADVEIKPGDGLTAKVLLLVEQRKRAFFTGQVHRRHIRRALDRVHPVFRQLNRRPAAIARTGHDQGIGEPGNAEADAALGLGLALLFRQREVGNVDGVVHHSHRGNDQRFQLGDVETGVVGERVFDQLG